MKKNHSSITARATLGTLLLTMSVVLVVLAFATSPSQSGQRSRAERNAPAVVNPAPVIAPEDPGPQLGFENFEGPGVLTTVTTSSQGQPVNTVEYIAHDAGEPSIGVNWASPAPNNVNGVTAFQSDLQTLFVTFNDSCNLAGPKATWVNRPAPTSQGVDQDPIGFVDRVTGRTFAAQLTLTSPTCKTSYTDDDGLTWVPTAGFGIGSGIDHQTIGGGPYHAPVPALPTPYQHSFYYCSQLPQAACARSDDGGLSFGPVVPIDPVGDANCIGIHGHVKVGPDGTAYVPTNNCNGQGSVIESEDNGVTWTIRHVTGTTSSANIIDAQVAIGNDNKVYFIMSNSTATGSNPVVATSIDHGQSWQNVFDLGAARQIQNVAYPYAMAADTGRGAVAFLGTTTAGDLSANGFLGVWHLYIAATFDGGATWSITDATPNDPLQRGCIWAQGGANICRNLLDFIGASVDKQGRIEVAYVDGCADGTCDQAVSSTTRFTGNGYTARGVIARQSSGRRLVAAFDPPNPLTATSVPGMPSVNLRRVNGVVHLAWSEADSGNQRINGYQVLRGIASGGETLLATVPGTQISGSYDDLTATDATKTYYYKVVATNSTGNSCANNEIAAPFVGDTCTGLILQKTPPNHPEQTTQGQTPASLAIDYIALAEPPSTSNFVFTMKTTSLATVPPLSRWRIVWNSESAAGQQYYVGMRTDNSNPPVASFEYGTIATAVVGLVIGVPTETKVGNGSAGSGFNADGTITIIVPKSVVGNPQPGDLLGAVNGRTFTGDTPESNTLERSNALMDHTFAKAQRDNGHPAATYMVNGNTSCTAGPIVPISAVSRKTHGSTDFDVDLLGASTGIECRTGPTAGDHKVVITFTAPISLGSATVTPGSGGTASMAGSPTVNGAEVTINLTNVSNVQVLTINLIGVNDGTHSGNVSIPMGVLLGDVNASSRVDSGDVSLVRQQTLQTVTASNFREDINTSNRIDAGDVSIARQQTLTSLP